MTRSSADIEREVEATRGQIDRTVEALREKMQPKELFGEATRAMGGASKKMMTNVVDQAKENTIPLALIGAGIAWWALSQRRTRSYDPYAGARYYETYEGYDDGDSMVGKLKQRAASAVDSAKYTASNAVDRAKDGLSTARASAAESLDTVKTRAAGIAADARQRAGAVGQQAQAKFQETLDTEPLILGAIAVAVGAAVGASIPASETENRLIGPHRDRLVGKGREIAQSGFEEARSVAGRAYEQVKEELQH